MKLKEKEKTRQVRQTAVKVRTKYQEESMYPVVKRCIDIVVAGLGLIVLSPILVVITVVWIQMGWPIMF